MNPACSDSEFIEIITTSRSLMEASRRMGVDERNMRRRRKRLEADYGPINTLAVKQKLIVHEASRALSMEGTIVVFSDCHWWPGRYSPAHLLLLKLLPKINPDVVILNGDGMDGYQISRHSRIGWDEGPTAAEEIETCKLFMDEIKSQSKADHYMTMGNHDIRFDTFLSSNAPQMEGVKGTRLSDHLDWPISWSISVNDKIMIKHRWKGGVHAARNNALNAGISIVTGHDHKGYIRPVSDYTGTRYGACCGTLSDPRGDQFLYCEHNPLDWQPGFLVIHVDEDSHHMVFVDCSDGTAWYHGKRYKA